MPLPLARSRCYPWCQGYAMEIPSQWKPFRYWGDIVGQLTSSGWDSGAETRVRLY
jgi:hypothetical protein